MPFTVIFAPDREKMNVETWCDNSGCLNTLGQGANAEPCVVFGVPVESTEHALVTAFVVCSAACRDALKAQITAGKTGEDYGVEMADVATMSFVDFWQIIARGAGLELAAFATTQDLREIGQIASLMQ
jgi:hypothetical protein